ncbi:hypothetical protein BC567DRAFT_40912 [Phyllosticta citribraziliensis]
MADPADKPNPVPDRRAQLERSMEQLEWLGTQLHPLEQTILLNNLDRFMKDSDNMVARIKRGERPAEVFGSSPDGSDQQASTEAMTTSAPRRRRLSAGPARASTRPLAVVPGPSDAGQGPPSPGNGVCPGNPRKRCRDVEE